MARVNHFKENGMVLTCMVVGDVGVGKSTLINTGGANVGNKPPFRFLYNRLRTCRLFGGQIALYIKELKNDLHSPTNLLGQICGHVLVVYDITNAASFDNARSAIHSHQRYRQDGFTQQLILVGTKSDLKAERAVDYRDAKYFANAHKIPLIEVNATKDIDAHAAFDLLILEILKADHPAIIAAHLDFCKHTIAAFLQDIARAEVALQRKSSYSDAEKKLGGSALNLLSGNVRTNFFAHAQKGGDVTEVIQFQIWEITSNPAFSTIQNGLFNLIKEFFSKYMPEDFEKELKVAPAACVPSAASAAAAAADAAVPAVPAPQQPVMPSAPLFDRTLEEFLWLQSHTQPLYKYKKPGPSVAYCQDTVASAAAAAVDAAVPSVPALQQPAKLNAPLFVSELERLMQLELGPPPPYDYQPSPGPSVAASAGVLFFTAAGASAAAAQQEEERRSLES